MSYAAAFMPLVTRGTEKDDEIRALRRQVDHLRRELRETEKEADVVLSPHWGKVDHLTEICRSIMPLIEDPLIRFDMERAIEAVEEAESRDDG